MNEILDKIILNNKKDYKCFDLLFTLIKENNTFNNILINGILNNKIFGFNDELWSKIEEQNQRTIISFDEALKQGLNIGACTTFSKQLSYSLNNVYICGGILPFLINTKNSKDGSHTWILKDNMIYDTTLMLIIEETYAKEIFKYIELNKYDPTIDKFYLEAKQFINDKSLKSSK